jgi:hypothetical protein
MLVKNDDHKYEVVELSKNTQNEDRTQAIIDRWPCDNEYDAFFNRELRETEATILGQTDSTFEAWVDGAPIEDGDEDVCADDEIISDLVEMGYAEAEILAAMGY